MAFPPDEGRNHQETQYDKHKNVWSPPALRCIWADTGRDLGQLVWTLCREKLPYLIPAEKRPIPPTVNAAPTISNSFSDSIDKGSLSLSSTGTVKQAIIATSK